MSPLDPPRVPGKRRSLARGRPHGRARRLRLGRPRAGGSAARAEMLATWDYPEGPNEAVDAARAVDPSRRLPDLLGAHDGHARRHGRARRPRDPDARSRRVPGAGCAGARASSSRGDDGRPTRIVGTVNDIDELWKGRDIARESQMRLQGIVDSAMDAIISIDGEQRITLFNRAAERIFGYEPREVLGQPLEMLIPARFHREHHRHVESFGRHGISSRPMMAQRIVTALRKSGEEFPDRRLDLAERDPRPALLHGDPARRVAARAHAPRARPGARGPARALRGLAHGPRAGKQPHLARAPRRAGPEPHLAQDGPRLARGQPARGTTRRSRARSPRCARSSTARWPRRGASPPTCARSCWTTWGCSPPSNGSRRRPRAGTASTVDLAVDEASENLAEPLASQVYRIVQESLTNAGRHAAAQHVRVALRTIGRRGPPRRAGRRPRPRPRTTCRRRARSGWSGIRERAYILAGSVEIRGDPGHGTVIHVRLPMPVDHEGRP